MGRQKKKPSAVDTGKEPPSQAAAAEALPSQLDVAAEDTPRLTSAVNAPTAESGEDAAATTETAAAVLASAAAQDRKAEAGPAAGAAVAAELAEEPAAAEAKELEGGVREEAAAGAEPSEPAGHEPRGRDHSQKAAPAAEADPQLLPPESGAGLASPRESPGLDAVRTPITAERWRAQAEPRGRNGPGGSSAAPTTCASHGAPAAGASREARARSILTALDVEGARLAPMGWAGPSVSPSPRASTARASEGAPRSPALRSPRDGGPRSPALGSASPRSPAASAASGVTRSPAASPRSLAAPASPRSPLTRSLSASASAPASRSASASASASVSASASASRLATPERRGSTQRTPERRGGTQRAGERYSASLAAATFCGPASPAAATHRWLVAREGEPNDAKIWEGTHASEGFGTPQHALRAATTVVVAMPTGMPAQRTVAFLQQHGYVATLAPSGSAVLRALGAPGAGLRVLLAEAHPRPQRLGEPPHGDGGSAAGRPHELGVRQLRRAIAAAGLDVPLAVLLPHARRAEAAQLRQDGAAACLTRPLVAQQVAALWQLGMQQLVASRDAESALRQEARRKQRAFVAGLREFGWPAV